VTYIVNPDKKGLLSTKVEELFNGNRNENRIAYFLKRGGVFEIETLVARVVTNTLTTIAQIGHATADKIRNIKKSGIVLSMKYRQKHLKRLLKKKRLWKSFFQMKKYHIKLTYLGEQDG